MNLKSINNWVLVRRDAQDDTHCGLVISDEAQIKSMVGEVVSNGGNKFVEAGQRVHIPHFQVIDYSVRGEELAAVKGDLLFAVQEGDDFRPINGYVKVRKCVNDHVRGKDDEVVIYRTENFIEKTNYVEVLSVAPDCTKISDADVGSFCVAPESNDRLQRLLYSKDYMIHEDLIEFTTEGE